LVSDLNGDDPVVQSDVGFGVEGQVRYTPGAFSIGAGAQWTTHDSHTFDFLQGSGITVAGTPTVRLYGLFVEPRYTININSQTVAPYVSARVAWLKVDNEGTLTDGTDSVTVKGTASGPAINLGGGFLFRLTSRVNFDAGFTYGYVSFGDLTIEVTPPDPNVPPQTSPTKSGTNFVGRLGVAIGL